MNLKQVIKEIEKDQEEHYGKKKVNDQTPKSWYDRFPNWNAMKKFYYNHVSIEGLPHEEE